MKLLIIGKDFKIPPESALALERASHRVTILPSVQEAAVRLKSDPMDLILLDTKAEGFQGIETYRHLKDISGQSQILFLSSSASDSLLSHSNSQSAFATLYKPLDQQELLGLVSLTRPSPLLIATDIPHSHAQQLLEILKGKRHNAGLVGTLVESIEILKNRTLDVLLLEMEITDLKALEDLERIKKVIPDAHFLTLSNDTMESRLETALQMGQPTVLYKPLDLPALLDNIQKIQGSPTKEKILLIDDDPNSLKSIMRTLRSEGYQVFPFEKGIEALKAAKTQFFHVALVDFQLQLSDFTGLEVVQKLNAMSKDTATILMTEYASFSTVLKAMEENVYECLVKPINPPVLKTAVEKALEKQKLALENKRLVEDLKKANQELLRLNELKSKFLSMVSHDLRSPLTAITGYSEFLAAGHYGPLNGKQISMVKIVLQEGDYLNCLISDLMDMASIEAGTFRLNKKPVLFSSIIKELLPRIEILTTRKEITLMIDNPTLETMISADAQRLKQVFTNLLTNAVKHTSKGGGIVVRASVVDDFLKIQVSDNGIGIPLEALQKIFEKFYQVESSPARSEGLGLGLAIAKEIVMAHHGSIGASSDGMGKGATFTVRLPMAKD